VTSVFVFKISKKRRHESPADCRSAGNDPGMRYAVLYYGLACKGKKTEQKELDMHISSSTKESMLMLKAMDEKNKTLGAALTDDDFMSSEIPLNGGNAGLSSDVVKAVHERLLDLMETKKLFLDPELTLDYLAQKMCIHRNTLSLLINHYCGSNYNDFINNYRIKEAKRILDECMNKKMFLKMWRISVDAGFNSRSTYYRVFKRFVGCTPFEYKSRLGKMGSIAGTESLAA